MSNNKKEDALYVRGYNIDTGVLTLTVQEDPITPDSSPNDAGDYLVALEAVETAGLIPKDRACCFILLRGVSKGATFIRFKNEQLSTIFFHKLVEGMKDHYSGANQVPYDEPEDSEDDEPGVGDDL